VVDYQRNISIHSNNQLRQRRDVLNVEYPLSMLVIVQLNPIATKPKELFLYITNRQ